jgi:hypothetical protein
VDHLDEHVLIQALIFSALFFAHVFIPGTDVAVMYSLAKA